jgi:membrane protease YdiL (CAAX protease family)
MGLGRAGHHVLTILGGMNYGDLIDRGFGYIVLFAIGELFIGFAEEGMFRGIGVTAFRANGYTEAKVALWTSVIFGLTHSTNIFTEGAGAIPQVLVTAAAGLFFYLGRGLLLPVLLHAAWDFSLFTGNLSEDPYIGGVAFIAIDVILVIILLIGAKKLHLNGQPTATAA